MAVLQQKDMDRAWTYEPMQLAQIVEEGMETASGNSSLATVYPAAAYGGYRADKQKDIVQT